MAQRNCSVSRLSAFLALALPILAALSSSLPGRADDKNKEAPIVPPRQGQSETITLFNGKDLDGWEGYSHLWSVEDGVIVGKNT